MDAEKEINLLAGDALALQSIVGLVLRHIAKVSPDLD